VPQEAVDQASPSVVPDPTPPGADEEAHTAEPSSAPIDRPLEAAPTAAIAGATGPLLPARPRLRGEAGPAQSPLRPGIQRASETSGHEAPAAVLSDPTRADAARHPMTPPAPPARETHVGSGAPAARAAAAVARTAVRRPGLDLHAGLSGARASSPSVAQPSVHRAAERSAGASPAGASIAVARSTVVSALPARRPGLDVTGALFRSGSAQHHAVARAPEPAPAVPPSPPTNVVALPTTHETAPAVERAAAEDGPASAARHRLAEAPDDELEELATRLYDHIRFRLRTEFLIDRERAGLLTDRY
jgi:hypothetical protein